MHRIKNIACAENTYGYLLGLVLMTIPLPYAYSSIALILLLATSLIHALYKPKVFHWGYAVPVAFFLLMLVSLIWSVDVHKSVRGLERQLPFLLIPLAFWMMPRMTKKQFSKALSLFAYWMAFFGVFMMLRSLFRSYSGKGSWVYSYHYLVDLFDLNAIYISVMTSLSLLFLLFYKRKNFWNLLTLFFLSLFLVMLSSKNVLLITTFCVVIGIFISNTKSIKKWWGLTVVLLGIGVVLFYGPLKKRWDAEIGSDITAALTAQKYSDVYPWTGTSFRLFQARISYEMLKEEGAWLTGFGINAVQDKIAEKQNEYLLYCGYNTYNFHNQYVQSFAELGIFGFLLVLGLLWVLFQLYLKNKEPFALFVFLVMAFVFLTETYIWRQRGMFHFLLLYGLLVSLLPLPKKALDSV